MPKGNRGPKTKEFLDRQYKPQGEVKGKLAKGAIAVKLPEDIDKAVRNVPNMAAWLRRVITEAAQRELMDAQE